jgi:HlyD family secretion protein
MKKFKGKKLLILLLLVIVAGGGGYMALGGGIPVETALVDQGPVIITMEETGQVEAEGTILLTAKSMIDVKKLYVKEGDSVQAGALLLTGDEGSIEYDISALRAQASGLSAQLATADSFAQKMRTLYESGAISQSEYEEARTAAAQLRSQLNSLNYTIRGLEAGTDTQGVKSPITGVITELWAKEGEILQPGMTVAEISPLKTYQVKLQMIAREASSLEVGDPVTLKQKDEVITDESQVLWVSQKAKEVLSAIGIAQKRVEVLVSIPDSVTGLILGDDMEVIIKTDERDPVIRVPEKAVFEIEGKDYVYLVDGNKSRLVEIQAGLVGDDWIEVIAGLKEGDQVVLSPGNDLKDGQKLILR